MLGWNLSLVVHMSSSGAESRILVPPPSFVEVIIAGTGKRVEWERVGLIMSWNSAIY